MKNLSLLLALILCTCVPARAQLMNNGTTIVIESGATLVVDAGMTHSNTGSIRYAGEVIVEGNLTNTGELTSLGNNSALIFRGTTGSTFTVGTADIDNFELSKQNANVRLIGDLIVNESLDFTDGLNTRLILDANDLTLENNAIVTGVTLTKYVSTSGTGYLVRETNGVGSLTFPVGNNDGLTALTADYTGTSFLDARLKVRVEPLADPSLPVDVTDYTKRHWEVVAENITDYENAVTATYLATDVAGDENKLEGVSFANGEVSGEDAGRTGQTLSGTISAASATFTGAFIAALPVELTDFSVVAEGTSSARLSWVTASEFNTSHFSVERSTDGVNWAAIGRVEAAGFTESNKAYTYVDGGIPAGARQSGTVYYRLHIIDFDGYREYSGVRSVNFAVAVHTLAIYPNPTSDFLVVSTPATVTGVHVYDGRGARVRSSQARRVDLRGLPAGAYAVVVEGEGERWVREVVVE